MFRWFQAQIHKRKNDRAVRNQAVDVGTDAVFYDEACNPEQSLIHMGGNCPSNLHWAQLLEPRQDPLGGDTVVCHEKRQDAEGKVAPSVADERLRGSNQCPSCPSPGVLVGVGNLPRDSSSNISPMTNREGMSVNIQSRCFKENSSTTHSTLQPTEDALMHKVIGSSSSLQNHRQSPSLAQAHQENVISSQECIVSTTSSLQSQGERNLAQQEHQGNVFTREQDLFSTQYSQGQAEGSSQGLARTIATKQDLSKSTSSPQQELTENTSSSKDCVQNATSTKEHKGSVCNPQYHGECTTDMQECDANTSKSPELDTCCDFNSLNNTHIQSSSPLASSVSKASTDSSLCLESSRIHQWLNTSGGCKKDEEQKNQASQKAESEFTSEVNLTQKLEQDTNKVVSQLQQKATYVRVREHGHDNEQLTTEVTEKSVTNEITTGVSDMVGNPLPKGNSEEAVTPKYEEESAKMEINAKTAVGKVDKFSQTQNTKDQCPNPCCYPQACLYNQKGRKCLILGDPFILTYLGESVVLVSTAIKDTSVLGPLGCMTVWRSGMATEFTDLPDGTEVYFDAVVSPKAPSFVAIVIWQDTKPTYSIQPLFNCYVIIDQIQNCPMKFISFSKENGVVSTLIDGKAKKIVFSKSVVYIEEQKVDTANEIKKLSKPTSKQLYADVLKLMTLENGDKANYEYMCSCMWLGTKPRQLNSSTVYEPFKLYKKAVGYFPVASKQSLVLCDVDAFLQVEGTTCKINFENEGHCIVLPCEERKLFSGSLKAHPVSGRVKVHLRKTLAKSNCTWVVLMVQVQPSSSLETTDSSTQPLNNNKTASPPQAMSADETSALPHTTATKSSIESAVLADIANLHQVTSGSCENDVVLRPQYTSTSCLVRNGVKTDHGKAALTRNNESNGEYLKRDMKLLYEPPCTSKTSSESVLKEESREAADKVKYQHDLIIKGNQSSHSDGVVSQDGKHAPLKLIKNGNGVLKNRNEAFILETKLQGKKIEIEMGRTPWVNFEDGKGRICQAPMADLPVGFELQFWDVPSSPVVDEVITLWSGKKPLKASFEGGTYYFDAPGVYYGLDEKGCMKFSVLLQGEAKSITAVSTTAIFEASGEHCTSLLTASHVFLHLHLRQGMWTPFLIVLQPKHKSSNLPEEAYNLSLKLLSLPESESLRSSSLMSQAEAKTGNWNQKSATSKTSSANLPPPYLRNLFGTLVEVGGRKCVSTHHKNKPLTVKVHETCTVDVNTVALNVKHVPLGTKLYVDAFRKIMDASEYWAVIVWFKKKPPKSVSPNGCIFYYNASGKCLNSSENEVSLEITLENKTEHISCKTAYVILPDGTSQPLESLRAGTQVRVNLLHENQHLSLNHFIYVASAAVPSITTTTLMAADPETAGVTRSVEKKTSTETLGSSELLPNTTDNLKNSEAELKSPNLKSVTTDKKEVAVPIPDVECQENEYDVVKGTISQLQRGVYMFSDDSGNLKVNVNPMQIALDTQPNPESPTGEFYLAYHRKTKVGVCGWYRHQIRQVYLQFGMIVHSHNLSSKLITLRLPDHSSLYNFIFDSEVIITGNSQCRFQQQFKSGRKVHPVIEDIDPTPIDGCVVSHRIVLMTTLRGLSVVCLNFLKHSLFGNEENKIPGDGLTVNTNSSLPSDSCKPCEDSSGRDQDEGATSSLRNTVNTGATPQQQQQVKQKIKPLECLNTSEEPKHSEISAILPHMVHLPDRYHEADLPVVDGEGDTLKELICRKHPQINHKARITRYVSLCGEIQEGNAGTHMFCSRKLPAPIELTSDIPHCDPDVCEGRGTRFMLARKVFEKDGTVDHQPVIVWPEERKCDPYIVVTNSVSRKNKLLMITDAADGKEKWYLFDYCMVFSLKNSYTIGEVMKSYAKQNKPLLMYAVVEKVPPLHIEDQYVEGNVLLLTTSKNVAVSSVDVFIGSCYEEEVLFQEPVSQVLQMLHQHKVRMERAARCKRGSTYYFSSRDNSFDTSMQSVGGCLEAIIDDFAIIRCGKRSNTAVCHLSNVYYQGKSIESWGNIPKHHWKNFWAIILPLDVAITEGRWEMDAVALVTWCCRGPRVLAMHQCYYHVPTPYVPYHGIESQEATLPSLLQSQGTSLRYSLESCAGAVMSLEELESWECRAGSTIFSLHDSILQSSGVIKLNGKVTLVNGIIVLFTSTDNEVVTCNISDIFIRGKRCESVKRLIDEIDQTFTLMAQKCSPVTYLGKTIQMEVIIAFIAPLKGTGIHVCNKHACILENNPHKEEIAIAEEAFHDIAVLCEQSAQCSNYHLSKVTTSEVEIPKPPGKRRRHTLCCGSVIGIDSESPEQVRVQLHQGQESFTLPVSRSRLMGLPRDLSLQHAVGHPVKAILHSVKRGDRQDCKILTAWGNFSESSMSSSSTPDPELPCSQKSKLYCCQRSLEVNEFQRVCCSRMFEIKTLYKLKEIDEKSGRGFFHYWLDEKFVTCKTEYILGFPKVKQCQEKLWNLLVYRKAETKEEYPEALAAWQGDCDSLTVEVCDVHGIHGLNVSTEEKRKTGSKSIPSPPKRGRCNSEPSQSILPDNLELMLPSRHESRRNSEPQDTILSASIELRQSDTIEEDNPVLSSSLPCRAYYPSCSGPDTRSREYKNNLLSNPDSVTLVSIEENSVTKEGKVYPSSGAIEQVHDQMCMSSVCNENDKNVIPYLESERVIRPAVTTITANSFVCLDSNCGLIIDSISCAVVLVRQGRLYVNQVKPKESFIQLLSSMINYKITAVVVPLASLDTVADLKVTHEAVLAWLGSRPAGIGSMIKNINRVSCQQGNKLQDETKPEGKPACSPDTPQEADAKTMSGIAGPPEALSGGATDFSSCATQHTDDIDKTDINRTSEEREETSQKSSTAQPIHPSSVCGSVSGSFDFVSQSKTETDGNFRCTEDSQSEQLMHAHDRGSLWAARPTLRIVCGKQSTISECIVGGYEDCCGILKSASGPILFDRKLFGMTQQAEAAFEQKKNLNAVVLELEKPVEILGCEARKIAMVVWTGKKPEGISGCISESLDVYKMNWIVVICNTAASTKNNQLKQSVCHSFYIVSSQNCDTSCNPEVLYYCSHSYSVGQHELLTASHNHVILKYQDSLVLALRDDVKCSEHYLTKGQYVSSITVKLTEPFEYCSLLITHFSLLVYAGETEPPEAATIKEDWIRGRIEKVMPLVWKGNSGLESVNIRVQLNWMSDVKPYSLDHLWPLTSDRPEGEMIFAVECEVLKVKKKYGVLKANGRMLKGNHILIFFQRDAVLINSKSLPASAALNGQIPPVQEQIWRCTARRLVPQEIESVKKKTKTEPQYKAKLLWCEICPSLQSVQIPENEGVARVTDGTAPRPGIPAQPGGESVQTGPAEGMKGFCAMDTPLTIGSRPENESKEARDSVDNLSREQSTRVGRLTEVHRTVAQVALEDDQLKYVAREKCFLYGLCLGKVELWHVLSIGLSINFEMTEDGKELKKMWVGDLNTSTPSLLDTVRDWCLIHNVTPSATTVLLLEAGWLPAELAPTAAPEDDTDVVDVAAPKVVF